jgi:hypothetical protein
LVLWVYNSEFDVVREVELVPKRGWGGEGALGAVLGFGALHRLPVGLGEEVQAPGEKLFDAADRKSLEQKGDYGSDGPANAFSPAPTQVFSAPPMVNSNVAPPPMISPNAPPPMGSAPSRTKKTKHHVFPKAGFDDMFEEGLKKSAEHDHVPSRKGTPLAPPPRIGSATVTPHSVTEEKQDPMEQAGEDLGEPGEAEES